MKIGIIADVLDKQYAGIYYFARNLIKALLNTDKTNEYVLIRSKSGEEKFNCQEVVIPSNVYIPGYQIYRLLVLLPRAAQELKLDVIVELAHFGPLNIAKNIKKVTVIHDLTPIINPSWHPLHSWLGHKLFIKKIADNADLIITNSLSTKKDVNKLLGVPKSKITTALLGISQIFKPTIDKKTIWKYGLYKPYFLFLGTLEPRKNLINLIKAYERYRKLQPNSKEQLIIAGKKGWKIKNLIHLKNASPYKDDIIFLGYVEREDMPAIYSSSSVFIYPSFYEGFGLPVCEAMACGVPVAISDCSSLPEVGNTHAIYFDPNKIEAMAAALQKAKSKSQNDLEDQVRYSSKFSWENTASKVLEGLHTLSSTVKTI